MFRVRQSFETSKLMDEMFINLREFFTPTPQFQLSSVPVSSAGDDEMPMSEQSLRRRRRRRMLGYVSGINQSTKLY